MSDAAPVVASSTCIFGGLPTAARELPQAGITKLEVYELSVPGHPEVRHLETDRHSDDELRALGAALAAEGLSICAIAGHADLLASHPDLRQTHVASLRRCIEAATILGASTVVTATGHGTGDHVLDWNDLVQTLRALGEEAGQAGIRIAVEYHYGEFLRGASEMGELMAAIGLPSVGVNYDPWHYELAGEDLTASTAQLGHWVNHTHLHDVKIGWQPGGTEAHLFEEQLGRGTIDWQAVFRGLLRAGYAGPLVIELHKVFRTTVEDHRMAREFIERTWMGSQL